ncbi:hypothetical protein WDW86_20990 [Bdellovibrionota bacterium FG-2]
MQSKKPKIHHNKIHGGDASHATTGIYDRYSDAYVYNNFIFAGTSTNTYGISWIQNIDAPIIWNNLLFFSGGAGTKACISMWADADSGSVTNNGFDCTILHRSIYPATPIDLTTLAAFENRGMGTGNFMVADNPWTFATPGTPSATWGATDFSITDDFFGTARTAGWSIGAHEQNN